jgi:hypothetical protein
MDKQQAVLVLIKQNTSSEEGIGEVIMLFVDAVAYLLETI